MYKPKWKIIVIALVGIYLLIASFTHGNTTPALIEDSNHIVNNSAKIPTIFSDEKWLLSASTSCGVIGNDAITIGTDIQQLQNTTDDTQLLKIEQDTLLPEFKKL